MGMTLEQGPDVTLVHGAFEPLMYVVTSTAQADAANFKFRYILDLYVDVSGVSTMVSRVRVYPNSAGAGVFRVDKLIQNWMSITKADTGTLTNEVYDKTIHQLGINTLAELWGLSNGENYRTVTIKIGQEYASSLTTDPTPAYNVLADKTLTCIMSAGLKRTDTWDMGIPNFLNDEAWIIPYLPTSYTSLVFSDRTTDSSFTSTTDAIFPVVHQDVTFYESRTLGLGMDGSAPQNSVAVSAWIGLYNSSDSLIDSGFITAATSGGTAPGSVTTDAGRLQYIGVGPWNLINQTIDPSFGGHFNLGNVAYYEVIFMQDSTTVPSDANKALMASCCYQYTLVDSDCMYGDTKYNYVTVAWQNSFGSWDYQSFNLEHQRSTGEIKRSTFEQVEGNWDTADAAQDFNFRGDQGGTRIAKVSATQELSATTDLFNEKEVALLETLYLSPNVYLLGTAADSKAGTVTPIIITDTNFVRKNNLNERGPFLYQIKFKYAKNRPTTKGGTYRGY